MAQGSRTLVDAGTGETEVAAAVEVGSGESAAVVVEEEDSDESAGVDAEVGGTLKDGVENVTHIVGIRKKTACSV